MYAIYITNMQVFIKFCTFILRNYVPLFEAPAQYAIPLLWTFSTFHAHLLRDVSQLLGLLCYSEKSYNLAHFQWKLSEAWDFKWSFQRFWNLRNQPCSADSQRYDPPYKSSSGQPRFICKFESRKGVISNIGSTFEFYECDLNCGSIFEFEIRGSTSMFRIWFLFYK